MFQWTSFEKKIPSWGSQSGNISQTSRPVHACSRVIIVIIISSSSSSSVIVVQGRIGQVGTGQDRIRWARTEYIHVCVQLCIYICIYIHTHIHTYLPTYLHTYIHVCIYIYIYMYYIYIRWERTGQEKVEQRQIGWPLPARSHAASSRRKVHFKLRSTFRKGGGGCSGNRVQWFTLCMIGCVTI